MAVHSDQRRNTRGCTCLLREADLFLFAAERVVLAQGLRLRQAVYAVEAVHGHLVLYVAGRRYGRDRYLALVDAEVGLCLDAEVADGENMGPGRRSVDVEVEVCVLCKSHGLHDLGHRSVVVVVLDLDLGSLGGHKVRHYVAGVDRVLYGRSLHLVVLVAAVFYLRRLRSGVELLARHVYRIVESGLESRQILPEVPLQLDHQPGRVGLCAPHAVFACQIHRSLPCVATLPDAQVMDLI